MSISPSESAPVVARPRRWKRWGLLFAGLSAIVIVLAPPIIAKTGLRNALLGLAFRDLNGSITAERAELSWFRPIEFHGIDIRSGAGEEVIHVDAVVGNMPLWRIALLRDDIGNIRIERPHARIVVNEETSNVQEVFAAKEPDEPEPEEPDNLAAVPKVNVSLAVVDASVSLQRVVGDPSQPVADDPSRWITEGINLSAGIRRSAANPEQAILFVEKGKLIDRAEINRDVSHAWLKYIAPILADSTTTEGSFSVDLDEWQIPLDAPDQGTAGGRLVIHHLDVVPGQIGQAITRLLRLPTSVVASEESTVEFRLANARVHHKDLRFTLGGLPVETKGSVGLDQTLDLIAEVTLPNFENEEAPIRRALSGRKLAIPIRGTLDKPEVDSQTLARSGVGILNDVLSNLGERLGTELPQITPPGETPAPNASENELPLPEELTAPGEATGTPNGDAAQWQQTIESAIPLVQEALRNRRERMQQQAEQQRKAEGSAPLAPEGAMPDDFPERERPLRARMRRLLQGLGPPVEAPAPAPDKTKVET